MHSALAHVVPSLPLSQEKVCFGHTGWNWELVLDPLPSCRNATSHGAAAGVQSHKRVASASRFARGTCCISPQRTCALPQWEMQRLLFGDTGQ